jgi:hypothetical protein
MEGRIERAFFQLEEISGDPADVVAETIAVKGSAGVEGTQNEES